MSLDKDMDLHPRVSRADEGEALSPLTMLLLSGGLCDPPGPPPTGGGAGEHLWGCHHPVHRGRCSGDPGVRLCALGIQFKLQSTSASCLPGLSPDDRHLPSGAQSLLRTDHPWRTIPHPLVSFFSSHPPPLSSLRLQFNSLDPWPLENPSSKGLAVMCV